MGLPPPPPQEESLAHGLILKQAASSEEDGDLRAAGEMYLTAGKHRKAVEIFVKVPALDSLIEAKSNGEGVCERCYIICWHAISRMYSLCVCKRMWLTRPEV